MAVGRNLGRNSHQIGAPFRRPMASISTRPGAAKPDLDLFGPRGAARGLRLALPLQPPPPSSHGDACLSFRVSSHERPINAPPRVVFHSHVAEPDLVTHTQVGRSSRRVDQPRLRRRVVPWRMLRTVERLAVGGLSGASRAESSVCVPVTGTPRRIRLEPRDGHGGQVQTSCDSISDARSYVRSIARRRRRSVWHRNSTVDPVRQQSNIRIVDAYQTLDNRFARINGGTGVLLTKNTEGL